jgi:choline kinase
MRAIILAAGRGSRLSSDLSKKPKCFLEIRFKKIIDYQIENITSLGINNIGIVTGYKSNMFKIFNKNLFHNKKWRTTNMVYSLIKANDWLSKYECLVTYGDIIYEKNIIKNFLNVKNEISVLYDKNWKELWRSRFKDIFKDAETFKYDNKHFLTEIGKKTKNITEINGQFMGIMKFKPRGWKKFKIAAKILIKKNSKIYTTDVLDFLVQNCKVKIKTYACDGKWCEIDTRKDFLHAKKIF